MKNVDSGRKAPPDRPAQSTSGSHNRLAESNTRVLVVDDDKFIRTVLQLHLEECGFQVKTASDGNEAFRMVPGFAPHVVVMDVIMPGSNGYRVSRSIKELGKHGMDAGPKIVLLTGRRVDDDSEREAMFLRFSQADAMLYKPCDPVRLVETISKLLAF